MKKNNFTAFIMASSALLLVACQNPGTDSVNSSSVVQESVSDVSVASEAAVSSSEVDSVDSIDSVVQNEATSSQVSASASEPTESTYSEQTVPVQTETVDDGAALLERAKQKITALTGYVESENYLFLIEAIEGDTATINVRENGEAVASSLGFYRYDDTTGNVQEMDIVTGEYVDFPANE